MKIISPLFSVMSGRLGGAVGATARGGVNYLRSLVIPGNPNTQFQTAVRNIMTGLAGAWRATLTLAQRTAWEDLANSGSGTVSGEALYVGNNSVLTLGGGARQDTAPASASCILSPFTTAPTIASSTGQITVTLPNVTDPWAATQGGVLNVFITPQQSASRLARQFSFQLVDSVLRGVGAPTTPFTIDYPPALGSPVAGRIVYIRFVSAAVDGRKSGEQIFRMTVS